MFGLCDGSMNMKCAHVQPEHKLQQESSGMVSFFFWLQALHGIKPSRVTSKSTDSKLFRTKKQRQKQPPITTRATPIPPARIGVPRKKQATTPTISESVGRQASPDKKPIKKVQLYKSKKILAKYQKGEKIHRPRRSKTCKRWLISDNGRPPASVRPARNGYPQDRPPQISNRQTTNYNQPSHSAPEASSRHRQPRMAVSAKECPSLGVILSVEQLCLPETSVSGS